MTSRNRIRLRDARTAMRRLQADPHQTDAVFEIVKALAGGHPRRLLERIRRDPEGARLLRERPLFDPTHADMEALERLPAGSFGIELVTWMRAHGFEPGLGERQWSGESDVAYVGTRLTEVHDFWHVLSGYNGDPVGELGFIAFSVGQTGTPGFAYILANAVWRSVRDRWRAERRLSSPLVGYVWRAYGAGRRARFLPPIMLEDYFPLPIESVRRELRIEPLQASLHPDALPPIAAPPVGSAGPA